MFSGGRKEEVVVVGVGVGVQKGTTGDRGDQAGVLDVGSGDVWPRPEEVSYATPSCKKVTPGQLRQPPGRQLSGKADGNTYTSPHRQIRTHTHIDTFGDLH